MTNLGANQGQFWQRAVLAAGLAVLLAGIWPARAGAAVQGIGVSPTSVDIEVKAGQTYNGEITVINDGDRDVQYKIYAADYKVTGEDYVGDFTSVAAEADVSPVSWFGLPKGTFTAKARQQSAFPYTIAVPATAAVGGHYGAIFIETVPPPPPKGTALVSRVERVGTLFYLAVAGDLKHSGSIVGLNVPKLQWAPPITGNLRLNNTGNVHYTAEGTFKLSSPFGEVGKPVAFKGNVLPGTTRRFDIKLEPGKAIGLYNVTATVKYLDRTEQVSQWMLLVPKITFYVIIGTIILLLVLLVAMIIRRIRKRRR